MRVLRFAIVGVSNTLITVAVFNVAAVFFGVSAVIANALGWTVGFANSFVWNRAWTFRDRAHLPVRRTLPRFAVVNLLALAVSTAVIAGLQQLLADGMLPALPRALELNTIEAVAILASLVVNYSLSAAWAFGASPDASAAPSAASDTPG